MCVCVWNATGCEQEHGQRAGPVAHSTESRAHMHMRVGAGTCRCSNLSIRARPASIAGALFPATPLATFPSASAPSPSSLPCRHGVYAEDTPGGEVSTVGHVCWHDGPRHLGQAGIHLQACTTTAAATAAIKALRHNHQQDRAARCCAAWHSQGWFGFSTPVTPAVCQACFCCGLGSSGLYVCVCWCSYLEAEVLLHHTLLSQQRLGASLNVVTGAQALTHLEGSASIDTELLR